jgi:hypothetical protein
MEQSLFDPSIQPDFTADSLGLPRFTDIVVINTKSSILYQSPRYYIQPFE